MPPPKEAVHWIPVEEVKEVCYASRNGATGRRPGASLMRESELGIL